MTREEFLTRLRRAMSGLPELDIEEAADYYDEMIDDRMEDGMTEEQALAAIGSPEDAAAQSMLNLPVTTLAKAKVKKRLERHPLRVWEIVLLVLGLPLWLPLLLAAVTVALTLYPVLCVVSAAVLWSAELAIGLSGLTLTVLSPVMIAGHAATGFASLGIGLALLGMAVFGFFLCIKLTAVIARFSKFIVVKLKNLIIGKGKSK